MTAFTSFIPILKYFGLKLFWMCILIYNALHFYHKISCFFESWLGSSEIGNQLWLDKIWPKTISVQHHPSFPTFGFVCCHPIVVFKGPIEKLCRHNPMKPASYLARNITICQCLCFQPLLPYYPDGFRSPLYYFNTKF